MHVTRLLLHDFRNYESADLSLGPGAHLFVGSNGQGKTNLVEAIGYLATLGSHRVSSDQALVRFGQEFAVVKMELAHETRSLHLDVQIASSGANKARVGGQNVRSRDLARYFASVLFAPEDLTLVRGEPGARRRFLDSLLVTHSPKLGGVIADYERVLRQRNSLLRSMRGPRSSEAMIATLDVWDERMLELGSQIIAERLLLCDRLLPHLAGSYQRLVGADHRPTLSMRVSAFGHAASVMGDADGEGAEVEGGEVTTAEIRDRFTAQLAEMRPRELERGVSLVGPHRDDAVFWLNGLPARVTASHGESWSFALALKLAAAELVRSESRAGDPVLILDDVFAELDASRRSRLAEAIGDFEQVLITAAVLEDVPEGLRSQIIRISAGTIQTGAADE
ncbi:DNA replication/repair protein RecF [Pseudoclavibacter sp. JSM 162008]|uniref:DNA replication/repair protein RecF n=1 Tax=Pseudoclavibacter sp. JSM 162008 TaxID=3229855 RepID=UPI00352675A6